MDAGNQRIRNLDVRQCPPSLDTVLRTYSARIPAYKRSLACEACGVGGRFLGPTEIPMSTIEGVRLVRSLGLGGDFAPITEKWYVTLPRIRPGRHPQYPANGVPATGLDVVNVDASPISRTCAYPDTRNRYKIALQAFAVSGRYPACAPASGL